MIRNIKPDLVILDYHLPSMDGLELYDQLHASEGFERVPVLFMSAHVPHRELEQRVISFIEKPFELADLLDTIEQLLGS